jgi:hypothetical protein
MNWPRELSVRLRRDPGDPETEKWIREAGLRTDSPEAEAVRKLCRDVVLTYNVEANGCARLVSAADAEVGALAW